MAISCSSQNVIFTISSIKVNEQSLYTWQLSTTAMGLRGRLNVLVILVIIIILSSLLTSTNRKVKDTVRRLRNQTQEIPKDLKLESIAFIDHKGYLEDTGRYVH